MTSAYVMGLDLGKAADHTALAILDRHSNQGEPVRYTLSHLHRYALHTRYTDIVAEVVKMKDKEPLKKNSILVIDKTGVGEAISDMFFAAGLRSVGIVFHGGRKDSRDGRDYHVAKINLVAEVQKLLEQGHLKIIPKLEYADLLIEELQRFHAKTSQAGRVTFEPAPGDDWRTRPHDDLVFAVAVAVWVGEKAWPRSRPRVRSMRYRLRRGY